MYFQSNTNILEYNNDSILYESFCESCINAYIETDNEEYFDSILNEDLYHKAKRILKQNKGKVAVGASILGTLGNAMYTSDKIVSDTIKGSVNINTAHNDLERLSHATNAVNDILGHGLAGVGRQAGLVGLGAYGVGTGTKHYIDQYRNRPKSVISKKIASLRKVYAKWLQRANNAVEDREAGLAKRIAAKILNIIDGLLKLLQQKADGK